MPKVKLSWKILQHLGVRRTGLPLKVPNPITKRKTFTAPLLEPIYSVALVLVKEIHPGTHQWRILRERKKKITLEKIQTHKSPKTERTLRTYTLGHRKSKRMSFATQTKRTP